MGNIRSAIAIIVATLGFGGSATGTLLDRGPDMVYDDALNITWTRSANLPGSSNLTWEQANAWAANLVYAGYDDWRLPTNTTVGENWTCSPFNAAVCAASGDELAYMYYHNLGGIICCVLPFGKTGTQTAIGGQVIFNIQSIYWYDRDFDLTHAYNFDFAAGGWHTPFSKTNDFSGWAVRAGDVPEPATLALLALGLAGLGFSRRKHKK